MRVSIVRPLSLRDWLTACYLAFALEAAHILAIAVWHLNLPFTWTTLGAIASIAYAVTYRIPDEDPVYTEYEYECENES